MICDAHILEIQPQTVQGREAQKLCTRELALNVAAKWLKTRVLNEVVVGVCPKSAAYPGELQASAAFLAK